jgi:bifunctional non-homologous end joining protein LigD
MHRDVARCADSMASFYQIRRRSDAGLTAHRKSPHDEARRYALRLVRTLAECAPQHHILSAQASRRSPNFFLDYVRNGRGRTAIGSYSPRVREGVSDRSPVTWSRIEAGIRPDAFTMKSPFRARETTKPVRKRR